MSQKESESQQFYSKSSSSSLKAEERINFEDRLVRPISNFAESSKQNSESSNEQQQHTEEIQEIQQQLLGIFSKMVSRAMTKQQQYEQVLKQYHNLSYSLIMQGQFEAQKYVKQNQEIERKEKRIKVFNKDLINQTEINLSDLMKKAVYQMIQPIQSGEKSQKIQQVQEEKIKQIQSVGNELKDTFTFFHSNIVTVKQQFLSQISSIQESLNNFKSERKKNQEAIESQISSLVQQLEDIIEQESKEGEQMYEKLLQNVKITHNKFKLQ